MTADMLSEHESRELLGVSHDASHDEIIAARRRLARFAHPDRGGSHAAMVRINEACRILLAIGTQGSHARDTHPAGEASRTTTASHAQRPDEEPEGSRRHGFRDAPSFVIGALPVETFEILLMAAVDLGEIVDEDPPYLLEVLVRDPGPMWCRLELFPDAGSTTIILSCDVEVGYRVYSVEEIRDMWISTINAMAEST